MHNVKAGTKVECLRGGHPDHPDTKYFDALGCATPAEGRVYTVRAVYVCRGEDNIGIRLREIINPVVQRNGLEGELFFSWLGDDGKPNFHVLTDVETQQENREKIRAAQ